MNDPIGKTLIADVAREFANQRRLAERAVSQLDDEQLFQSLDRDANSVAVIMKHVGGNLRSRWTDFRSTDGEKPDRNRDGEFEAAGETRQSVESTWHTGWTALDAALASLQPADLLAEILIRGESHTVIQALNRSLAHTAQHVGQIILVAKHLRGADWQTLSIPRGQSSAYMSKAPTR